MSQPSENAAAREVDALREQVASLEKLVSERDRQLEEARDLPRRQMLWTGGMLWNL